MIVAFLIRISISLVVVGCCQKYDIILDGGFKTMYSSDILRRLFSSASALLGHLYMLLISHDIHTGTSSF